MSKYLGLGALALLLLAAPAVLGGLGPTEVAIWLVVLAVLVAIAAACVVSDLRRLRGRRQ